MSFLVPVLLPLAFGLGLLGLFMLGGKVQGQGEASFIASAARAFVTPWLVVLVAILWMRWWGGAALGEVVLTLVPAAILPIIAAFAVWRRFRA